MSKYDSINNLFSLIGKKVIIQSEFSAKDVHGNSGIIEQGEVLTFKNFSHKTMFRDDPFIGLIDAHQVTLTTSLGNDYTFNVFDGEEHHYFVKHTWLHRLRKWHERYLEEMNKPNNVEGPLASALFARPEKAIKVTGQFFDALYENPLAKKIKGQA